MSSNWILEELSSVQSIYIQEGNHFLLFVFLLKLLNNILINQIELCVY